MIIITFIFLFFSLFLSGCVPKTKTPITNTQNPTPTTPTTVPLPTGEDIIRTFFALINEKKIPEAVEMLSSTAAPDESTKQTWGVNFNTLDSIILKSIEEWQKSDWTENEMTYKVILVAQVKPNPQFWAWDNGENTKWISLVKEDNLWKISQIASGP